MAIAEGVDLYGLYNKVTDWHAVKAAGIEFAWVKVSDGTSNREDYGYVAAGRAVGIAMGGYHYAQLGDPIAQANRLIDRCVAYGALDIAPALDLEAPFVPGSVAIDFSIRFLRQVMTRGHVPCLYANNSMLSGILPGVKAAIPSVKVWGARYGGSLTVPFDVQQYTSTGTVPGIAGSVDRNRGTIIRNTTKPIPIGAPQVELADNVKMPNWDPAKPTDPTTLKSVNSCFAEDNVRVAQIKDTVEALAADVATLKTGGVNVDALAAQVAALVIAKMEITVTSKP